MGDKLTFREWWDDPAQLPNNFLSNVGESIIEGACNLRTKYPKRFNRGGLLSPVMNALCDGRGYDNPPPIPPPLPFAGGRCLGEAYDAHITAITTNSDGTTSSRKSTALCIGEIVDIRIAQAETGDDTRGLLVITDNGPSSPRDRVISTYPVRPATTRISKIEIFGADGALDDGRCDPPSGYPDDPPDNDGDFDTTVTVDTYPDKPDGEREPVDVDITYDRDNEGGNRICGEAGGVRFCITSTGIESGNDAEETVGDDTDGGGAPPDDLAEAEGEEGEEAEELDPAIKWVTVEITTLPFSGKVVTHADTRDNDYFAGYFHWLVEANSKMWYMPAIPIRKELSVYKAPEGVQGYRLYAVNGATLKPTTYKEQTEE